MSARPEQRIYKELCGLTSQVLTSNNLPDWASNVIQYGQATQQEVPSPAVMIDYNDGAKYGWESTKYKWDSATDSGKAELSYYRQIFVDFLFFKNPHDLISASEASEYIEDEANYAVDSSHNLTINGNTVWCAGNGGDVVPAAVESQSTPKVYAPVEYVSPMDVAQSIRTWFLSDFGIKELRDLGYGIIDSSEIENPTIQTDDDVYARTPRFTLTLVLKETSMVDVDFIKDYKLGIYPISSEINKI